MLNGLTQKLKPPSTGCRRKAMVLPGRVSCSSGAPLSGRATSTTGIAARRVVVVNSLSASARL